MMSGIRLPTQDDLPRLIELAREFHKASPYSALEFDESSCTGLYEAFRANPSKVIILMFDHGMIAGLNSTLPFSKDTVTIELAWYVDPTHRGSRESLLLLKAYEDWSIRVGAKICSMAMLDESMNLSKLYERQGYRPAEQSFIKVL